MPRQRTLTESKLDVVMRSTANIRSTAGQAQRKTDVRRAGGWRKMAKKNKKKNEKETGRDTLK